MENVPTKLFDSTEEEEESMFTLLCLVNQDGMPFDLLRKLFFHVQPEEQIFATCLDNLLIESFVVLEGGLIKVPKELKSLTSDEIGLVNDILPWRKIATSILKRVDNSSITQEEIPEIMQIWANISRVDDLVLENIKIPCHLTRLILLFSIMETAKKNPANIWWKSGLRFAKANFILLKDFLDSGNESKLQIQLTRATNDLLALSNELEVEDSSEMEQKSETIQTLETIAEHAKQMENIQQEVPDKMNYYHKRHRMQIPKKIMDPASYAIEGVYFGSTLLGCYLMSKKKVEDKIREHLASQFQQEESENRSIIETAALLIHSCNKPQEVNECVKILNDFFENIIQDQMNFALRILNYSDCKNIISVFGAEQFLKAARFEKKLYSGTEKWGLYVRIENVIKSREILKTTKPIVPELDRNLQVLGQEEAATSIKLPHEIKRRHCCVIRVGFPDEIILQGTFENGEKISSLFEFVKNFLSRPDQKFDLVKPNGEVVNDGDSTISSLRLPILSILNFSSENMLSEMFYLKPELYREIQDT